MKSRFSCSLVAFLEKSWLCEALFGNHVTLIALYIFSSVLQVNITFLPIDRQVYLH